ncbi:MAG: hypothetical protein ACRCYO_02310 [Bacteroidia bacterium]
MKNKLQKSWAWTKLVMTIYLYSQQASLHDMNVLYTRAEDRKQKRYLYWLSQGGNDFCREVKPLFNMHI